MITEEDIRRLYLEKTMGVITKEENKWLQEQLLQYPEGRKLWEELEKEESNLIAFTDKLEVGDDLSRVKQQLKESDHDSQRRQWFPYAAAVFLILVGGGFFYGYLVQDSVDNNLSKVDDMLSTTGKKGDIAIQLIVGDNEKVLHLDQKNDAIEIAGNTIKKEGDALIYSNSDRSEKTNTLIVPATKDYKLVLADGTKVWLNSSSQLKFPMTFSGPSRKVYLEGEAYFEIAQNVQAPFVVHTAKAKVHVLGTKFNLNAYGNEDVSTALLEGKVKMEAPTGEVMLLSPGNKGIYNPLNGFLKESFDINEIIAWKDGLYYFRHTSLQEIGKIMHRWFDVAVIFDNNNLKKKPITGLLDKKDLDGFLKDLQTTTGIHYQLRQDGLHLW
ncbi:FecR family protein [Olivibacter domesticus]|uniref:FecR family protein n=1 Tax=Olivibacter domesticus TaxID=407022 RepID=A0A1H7QGM6_OLID1|nr:FecR domain-containing protein [Olivibacter domesticus]SEL47083.1 FecR family protein [Olivibacter domesticus]